MESGMKPVKLTEKEGVGGREVRWESGIDGGCGCVWLADEESFLIIGELTPKGFHGVVKGIVSFNGYPDGRPRLATTVACRIDLADGGIKIKRSCRQHLCERCGDNQFW